jgi:hypothetical protein
MSMSRVPLRIQISGRDQKDLYKLLGVGHSAREGRFAGFSHAPFGRRSHRAALTSKAVRVIAHRDLEGGLDRALYDKQGPRASPVLQSAERQRIIAMICSDPPEGQVQYDSAADRRELAEFGQLSASSVAMLICNC